MSEAMTAQCSPPPSEPAKRRLLRPSAIGRIARSTTLESISMRPSSRKRVRPSHRRLHLDLVVLPAHVAPTESERDVTVLSELRIGAVAIDLQDAAESCEMLGRPRM